MVQIVCISDTHRLHRQVKIPPADIIIHAGDIGWEDWVGGYACLVDFFEWFGNLPIKTRIFVAGNHDRIAEWDSRLVREMANTKDIHYLVDEAVSIDGFKFWGSPWSLEFCNWSFNLPRDKEMATNHWNKIPMNADVVITHSMPYGILDKVGQDTDELTYPSLGDEWLRNRISKVMPKLYVGGHLHGGYGVYREKDIQFVNASVCDEGYEPVNEAIEVRLSRERALVTNPSLIVEK
jgi:Icc-related predicted phosphoesterase